MAPHPVALTSDSTSPRSRGEAGRRRRPPYFFVADTFTSTGMSSETQEPGESEVWPMP